MPPKTRYAELDLLRSLAVLGMVFYHAAYDLQMFQGWDIGVTQGYWKLFARVIAITFLLLVGISFAISRDKTDPAKRRSKFLKRGLLILGCGMLVTLATYVVDPETYVRFGILHVIGVSIVTMGVCDRKTETPRWGVFTGNAVMALGIIVTGFVTKTITVPTSLLLPLGLMPPSFTTVDYFPLIPWFGVILFGYVIGQILYIDHLQWRSHLPSILTPHSSILTLPGRYALIIYLLHQPVLLLGMYVIFPYPSPYPSPYTDPRVFHGPSFNRRQKEEAALPLEKSGHGDH